MKLDSVAVSWHTLDRTLIEAGLITSTKKLRDFHRRLRYGFQRLLYDLRSHMHSVHCNKSLPDSLKAQYLFELRNLKEYIERQRLRHDGDADAAHAEAKAANARRRRAGQPLIGSRGAFWGDWAPPDLRARYQRAFFDAGVTRLIPFTTRESRAAREAGAVRLRANIQAELAAHQPADAPWKALMVMALTQALRRLDAAIAAPNTDPTAWNKGIPVKWVSYCDDDIKPLIRRALDAPAGVALDWHPGIKTFYSLPTPYKPTLAQRIAALGAERAARAAGQEAPPL